MSMEELFEIEKTNIFDLLVCVYNQIFWVLYNIYIFQIYSTYIQYTMFQVID